MALKLISKGTVPNDGTGTPANEAADIINDNFAELQSGIAYVVNSVPQTIDGRLADQPMAEDGSDNARLMTPLRVKQQIDARIGEGAGFLVDGADPRLSDPRAPVDDSVTNAKVPVPASPADGILSSKLRFDQSGSNVDPLSVEAFLRSLATSVAGYIGADPTGTLASDAAFNSALAASSNVVVPAGTWKISTTATWARGKRVTFLPGATLSVDSGVTLTIRTAVDIQSETQVFTGSGTVLGIRWVRPEWFGATRTGTGHDDQPAFQKAQNCMEAGIASDGLPMCLLLSNGDYGIGAQIDATPNAASCIAWLGQGSSSGSRLIGLATFTGTAVLKLKADAVNSSGSAARFQGFRVIPQTAGSGALRGIDIGGHASLTLQGGAHEAILFDDVGVYDFAVCWRYENCRSITTRRCSGWVQTLANAVALRITATAATMFTGDLDLYNFQSTANATGAIVLDLTATASAVVGPDTLRATVSGVRFHSHIMYKGPASIIASGGGVIRDVWFPPGWQYDVVEGSGFTIAADGVGSKVRTVKFLNGYYAGGLVGAAVAFNAFVVNSGKLFDIDITGMTFKYPWGDTITLTGVTGGNVRDNKFIDVNGGDLIKFSACFNTIVEGNSIVREDTTGSCANFVVAGAGSDYYAVRNNLTATAYTGSPFSDVAAGAAKIADGNL